MGFGDLSTAAGVKSLNCFLASKSYIEGFTPSQADRVVFEALKTAPSSEFSHALRWYNHIKSFGDCRTKFSGQKKSLADYGGAAAPAGGDKGGDDDFDLFGDDDNEEEDSAKVKAAMAAQAAKPKKVVVAKSSVLLDVKPWDDETDMKELEEKVRSISMDGLVWGGSKFIPLAYGIKKLQIMCVVEDAKVSVDQLEEEITSFDDLCQSVDIAAFNKI